MIAIENHPASTEAPVLELLQIHAAGSSGLLLDAAGIEFSQTVQERIWALSNTLGSGKALPGVRETVPGINNLLVVFDPLVFTPASARAQLAQLWNTLDVSARAGRDIEVPVVYGGAIGEDLPALAKSADVSVEEYVRLHSSAVYSVACIGAYAGFGYLTGLPSKLSTPRRQSPRIKVPKGSVIIGGSQAGVMPCAAPSGWHLVGVTELSMFDPTRETPCLLAAGDRVHFRVKGIEA